MSLFLFFQVNIQLRYISNVICDIYESAFGASFVIFFDK